MTVIIDGTNGVQSVSGSATLASITNINDTNTGIFFPASETIALATSGSERLRVDSAGNMGLGVTPSASWRTDATLAVLEVKSAGSAIWNAGARNFNFSNNSYWVTGGSFQYASTGAAAWYQQTGGEHRFYNAASGTAGDTISFTQAMTLDASGNLGVGTTTINYRVVADCAGAGNNDNGIAVRNDNNSAYGGSYNFEHKVTSGGSVVRASYISSEGGSGTSFLRFATTNASTLAERARITGGGVLCVGATSFTDAGIAGFRGDSTTVATVEIQNESSTGTMLTFRTNGESQVGSVSFTSGGVTYNTTSDVRLKKNIVDAQDSGADIDALQVRSFDWESNDLHVKYGFVAQELFTVVPEAVTPGDADDAEELKNPWGVDYSKLVPMLVKEIQSLRARSSALEAKVAAAGL